jgi:hypothetical protein
MRTRKSAMLIMLSFFILFAVSLALPLFIHHYFGKDRLAGAIASAHCFFEEHEFSFGGIRSGGKYDHTFCFINRTDADIRIVDAKVSCGCVIADYTKDSIGPGSEGRINVSLTSRGINPETKLRKRIEVTLNSQKDGNHLEELFVEGLVSYDLIAVPGSLTLSPKNNKDLIDTEIEIRRAMATRDEFLTARIMPVPFCELTLLRKDSESMRYRVVFDPSTTPAQEAVLQVSVNPDYFRAPLFIPIIKKSEDTETSLDPDSLLVTVDSGWSKETLKEMTKKRLSLQKRKQGSYLIEQCSCPSGRLSWNSIADGNQGELIEVWLSSVPSETISNHILSAELANAETGRKSRVEFNMRVFVKSRKKDL